MIFTEPHMLQFINCVFTKYTISRATISIVAKCSIENYIKRRKINFKMEKTTK